MVSGRQHILDSLDEKTVEAVEDLYGVTIGSRCDLIGVLRVACSGNVVEMLSEEVEERV